MEGYREGFAGRDRQRRGPARTGQSARRRRARRRMQIVCGVFAVSLVLLFAAAGCLIYFVLHRVEAGCTVEAGGTISAEAFRHFTWDKGTFSFVEQPVNLNKVGTYRYQLYAAPFTYEVTVTVQDTTAPEAQGVRVVGTYGELPAAERFVTGLIDAAPCEVSFVEEPDTARYGLQEVAVLVTDQAGNRTVVSAELLVPNVKEQVTVEAGDALPEAEEFLQTKGSEIRMLTDPAAIDTGRPGMYVVELLVDGVTQTSRLSVVDTVAPTAVTRDLELYLNKPKPAEEFIVSVTDQTAVTVSYAAEPDWSKTGKQAVELLLTDEAGNVAHAAASLTLKKDTKAPEISVSNIDVIVGNAVSYKRAVNYSDDIDTKDEMTLVIDNSRVDLNKVGTYTVVYTVTDCSGNSARAEGKVNVLAEAPAYFDEEKIHAKADAVLAKILKDDMTDREKALAIYRWLRNNIGYISHSEKGDYMRGAYEGLFKGQGDCFVYAATAKELLTRAGIKNMDIVKSAVNPSHYWNLVDVGEGWYHFDATPRKDKTTFFLWTDAQLSEYSAKNKNSHIYDRSLYPEIN